MNKKILIIGVVVLIALTVGLYFFFSTRSDNAVVTNEPNVTSITYKNTDYGFNFTLPESWQGYTVINETWNGNPLTNTPAQTGPKLIIRNPKWTASAPYEDLPILVFTTAQWNSYTKEDFAVSAAPIPATELAHNSTYVFALPPRWNFDDNLGYKEAENIFAGNPISTFNIANNLNTGKSEAIDANNATYNINGQSVTLVNGVSIVPVAPGSQSMVTTRYFGNGVTHDFDADGRLDTAFILTQNTGGSGTFYYVVVALNTAHGYVGSSGFLLGDRIAPQTTNMSQNTSTPNVIIVNYADRKAGEPFTTAPSVGKSVWLKLDTKTLQLGEVIKNFEGEADPNKMTLGMKTWNWVNTKYSNGTTVTPKTNKFALTFKADKTFSATTDCNGVGGEYTVKGNKITFTKMMSTLMFCEGSQEQDYSKMLDQVESYMFTSKGELVLNLKLDTGSMIFK